MHYKRFYMALGMCALLSLSGCGGLSDTGTSPADSPSQTTAASGYDTAASSGTAQTADSQASTSTSSSQSSSDTLSPQKEQKIKEDYVKWEKAINNNPSTASYEYYQNMTTDNVRIEYYLGEYSGCDVLYITADNSMYFTATFKETIAGYTFNYNSSQVPCVYKNGEFTVLKAAYENGWITKDDVRDLAEKHG